MSHKLLMLFRIHADSLLSELFSFTFQKLIIYFVICIYNKLHLSAFTSGFFQYKGWYLSNFLLNFVWLAEISETKYSANLYEVVMC